MNIVAEEQQPLLSPTSQDPEYGLTAKQTEALPDFENGDVDDPRQWTPRFKWCIVLLLACMAFNVTFTCIGVVPVASSIASDLSGTSSPPSSTSALLVTIWELGEAAGPLLIAPLSETFGRYPVINVCNVAFVLSTLLAASSQSTGLFIAARMLTGLSVGTNVLSPAIIGDMFESEKRGSAMSLIMLAPLIGGAVGPAISGAIAQTLGWRQILLIAAGLAVCCEMLFLTCFRETYKMSILKSRAANLQHAPTNIGFVTDVKNNHGNTKKLWHSITRPFAVLYGSLVLLLLSAFGSVAFSYFYVMSISLPMILQDVYGFTPAQTGTAFMSFTVGSFCGVLLCNFSLDRIYIHLRGPCDPKGQPEYRLPMLMVGAVLLPVTVAFYGWIAHLRLTVGLLLLAVALLGFTIMLTIIPLSAYVVDAFGVYSASAMTGVIVIRCLMGTFLPLITGPLADNLGYGPGFTCFGALSLGLAVLPALIFRYGEKWRQRSEFTRNA